MILQNKKWGGIWGLKHSGREMFGLQKQMSRGIQGGIFSDWDKWGIQGGKFLVLECLEPKFYLPKISLTECIEPKVCLNQIFPSLNASNPKFVRTKNFPPWMLQTQILSKTKYPSPNTLNLSLSEPEIYLPECLTVCFVQKKLFKSLFVYILIVRVDYPWKD